MIFADLVVIGSDKMSLLQNVLLDSEIETLLVNNIQYCHTT